MTLILSWGYFPISSYPDLMFNYHDAEGLDAGPDIPHLLNGGPYGTTQPCDLFLCICAHLCHSLSGLNITMVLSQG